ncbi:SGNH/GDSL hydrolase family protein [Streptomyces olivochromogenes]|uniref:SGNH/GDSL hydrolase family protein n=1 Tax=Streptomyces olivochromogenes TaxID=1963 RepID=UPI001F16A055|nr:SGNH/GDSL hydrolase family protein [Streptomyces olivochromogenes]MCF3131331.1 SGNH/GDSL hydrolase family protein [Streptomyces olivochromogenes]
MRNRRRRRRSVLALTAVAALGLAGCDAAGDDSPAPDGTRAKTAPVRPVWNRSPSSIAAVGDSITRGFDACTVLSDCPEVSWATGTSSQVDSLAVRLLGRARAAENSWNYAVTGARMADLPAQMAEAVTRRPQLVTVMAGANDACRSSARAMTSVADFRTGFEEAMRTLRTSLPKAQVYVASVPNLKRLWSQGRTNPLGKQVWKLGICPSMLNDADDLDTAAIVRRDKVQRRVEAYNRVLQEVCAKDRRCRFDGGAVFDYEFGTDQLSHWDWFHPSTDGQARLAAIAYRTITAEEPVA